MQKTIRVDPHDPKTVYAGVLGEGIYKSTDGGTYWEKINTGLSSKEVVTLKINTTTSTTIYAGTMVGTIPGTTAAVAEIQGGVYKSIDSGMNWKSFNNGLNNNEVMALAIHSTASETLYIGTRKGIYKSTDGGLNWRKRNKGIKNYAKVMDLQIVPTNPDTLYAAVLGESGGIFKTINGGNSWKKMDNSLRNNNDYFVSILAVNPTDPDTIYAGTTCGRYCDEKQGGVFKSTDGGLYWKKMNNGLESNQPLIPVLALAISHSSPEILYVSTIKGVFKSIDGGVHWKNNNDSDPF